MTEERDYLHVSQTIFEDWLHQRGPRSAVARELFSLEHAPEPFLSFGDDTAPAIFVTTNPGRGFDYQRHPSVQPGGLFEGVERYADAAARLSRFYEQPKADISVAARSNISAMKRIARSFGASGVRQIEMIPWHSVSLPNKSGATARLLAAEPSYVAYRRALDRLLRSYPLVLSWSAGIPGKRGGSGMEMKAEQIGLNLKTAEMLILERRTDVSQALLWHTHEGRLRGLFVTQGAASLPSAGVNRAGEDKSALLGALARRVGLVA